MADKTHKDISTYHNTSPYTVADVAHGDVSSHQDYLQRNTDASQQHLSPTQVTQGPRALHVVRVGQHVVVVVVVVDVVVVVVDVVFVVVVVVAVIAIDAPFSRGDLER